MKVFASNQLDEMQDAPHLPAIMTLSSGPLSFLRLTVHYLHSVLIGTLCKV